MATDLLAKIALSPILIPQALGVRARALQLPEAEGPRTGRIGNGPPLRLLILGDSSAAGVGAETQDEALAGQLTQRLATRFTLDWQLVARTGATTANALTMLRALPPEPFDIAVLALGVNDVTHSVPLHIWLRHQSALYNHLRQTHGTQRILVSGVPPLGRFPLLPNPLKWVLGRQASRFDTHLARLLASRDDCTHIPFAMPVDQSLMARDGFHPAPPAYAAWAAALDHLI